MGPDELVGWVLIAGLIIFMIGAGAWRLAYEQPLVAALPVIDADRRRRAWIHLWMLAAMFITTAGVAGLGVLMPRPTALLVAVMGAVVYALGAVCWIVSLTFRLTTTPWAAERTVADGRVPGVFPPLDAWAGSLYVVHMTSAFASFVLLGVAVLLSETLPGWLGWLGVGWGGSFVVGFVLTRFAGPFNPPLWAHMYTGAIGLTLVLR